MALSRRLLFPLIAFIPLFTIALAGCDTRTGDGPPSTSPSITIVTTTPMLGDMARRIGGETAQVTSLLGEGVDPHLYKPTRTDIATLLDADVIVTNGLFLEGRMQDSFERAVAAGRTVINIGASIPADELLNPPAHGEAEAHPDPHIWMDPELWGRCGAILAEGLSKHDPSDADGYRRRAGEFAALAAELGTNAQTAIDSIPKARRELVTAHDAFGYFGRRFTLTVHAIQGISTESEAGLADLERLVQFLVERKIPAVFVESTVSPRTIEALIAGAKAQGHNVQIGGELYSDSMGAPGTTEGTWPGMIAHNVETIVTALGGTVPAGGVLPKGLRDER
ncbi:MAG: zinc ABC transporter substrate-binding protein [Phycisphaerae bacterium]|nr:zinc ABC transporter substrate-binding protein [Phycisphaerae bacterium]